MWCRKGKEADPEASRRFPGFIVSEGRTEDFKFILEFVGFLEEDKETQTTPNGGDLTGMEETDGRRINVSLCFPKPSR